MTTQPFKQKILRYFRRHKRDLPWRHTTDPYRIWVSEVMLQQTQVPRVIEKYHTFLKTFPTIQSLAKAPLSKVLALWQGLGYNRRAKHLHQGAKYIVSNHSGIFPKDKESLLLIPGVGPYTAGAIRVFAFNEPEVLIETNIRTVYTHHFFPKRKKVHDKELLLLIEKTCPKKNPRDWYAALMDYGTYLKQEGIKINSKSAHYAKQKPFKGSDREIRGKILRTLIAGPQSLQLLCKEIQDSRIESQLQNLYKEGLVTKQGSKYQLCD